MVLQPGIYKIRLAADPNPLLGVELIGPGAQPILTKGKENLWRVVQPDYSEDKYQLFILTDGGNVTLNIQSKDREIVGNIDPPETTWRIVGEDPGPYEIRADTSPGAWTVEDPSKDLSPVVLDLLPPVVPLNQKWYFTPRPRP